MGESDYLFPKDGVFFSEGVYQVPILRFGVGVAVVVGEPVYFPRDVVVVKVGSVSWPERVPR